MTNYDPIERDIRSHPNLMRLTNQGYVHTESYGANNQIWYLVRDDGSFKFYNVEKDEISHSKQLKIEYSGSTPNKERKCTTLAEIAKSEAL